MGRVGQAGSLVVAPAPLAARLDPSRLGGVTVVTGGGVTAVPYYAWNNRGRGQMTVWVPD